MKTDMKPIKDTNQSSESIQDRVLSQITTQCVTPRSKYVFWCQNSGIWLLWLLTVGLGGFATAVLIFTSTYRYYDIYEAMYDNFFTFFFEALPVLWIVMFVGLMLVATRGMRATRRGYRLSPWFVGGSSVGVSVLLGVVGSMAGFGFLVDQALGEYAPMYSSQAEREHTMWQQPSQGRLIGRQMTAELASETVKLIDVDGKQWTIDVQELRLLDRELLGSQEQVRVLGQEISGYEGRFHACGVFPWMLDRKYPIRELQSHRQEHIKKIYEHADSLADRIEGLEQIAFGEASADNVPSMKICASIAAVRRISEQMQ